MAQLDIPTFDDALIEATEDLRIELSSPSAGAEIGDGSGTGTIIDNDAAPPPELLIDDGPVQAEGDAGTTLFSFTLTRTGDLSGEITADWAVTGVGADPANPADFVGGVLPSGTVTFAAGEDTATIEIPVQGDTDVEPDEDFRVTLSAPTNATLGDAEGDATILNDDEVVVPPPELSIDDGPDQAEGDAGTTLFSFTVTRSGDLSGESTADWAVTGVGADPANAADFVGGVLPSGTVTFAAGEDTATIGVPVQGDTDVEPDEAFRVTLSGLTNATLGAAEGDATILNDNSVDNEGLVCGTSWGDPHYRTFDGLAYDFQGAGEYILVESTDTDEVVVQTRTRPINHNLTVNSAVATEIGDVRVTIDTDAEDVLQIDGAVVDLAGSMAVGNGMVDFQGNTYSITYQTGEVLTVVDFGSHLDVTFCASEERAPDSLQGLLGNFDGDPTNDLTTRDGSAGPFGTSLTFNELYGTFNDSWRISQAELLFDYGSGEVDRDLHRCAVPMAPGNARPASAGQGGRGHRSARRGGRHGSRPARGRDP